MRTHSPDDLAGIRDRDRHNDVAADWLREARRRADEIDHGEVEPVPANEVQRKVIDLIG